MPGRPSICYFTGSCQAGVGTGFTGGPLYQIPPAGVSNPAPQSNHAPGMWMTMPDGTTLLCPDGGHYAANGAYGCTYFDRFDLGHGSIGVLTILELCGAAGNDVATVALNCGIPLGLYTFEWYIPTFVTEPGYGVGVVDLIVAVHLSVLSSQPRCGDGGGGGGDGPPPPPPCTNDCFDDCPPCSGSVVIPSGHCATVCAVGGTSDTQRNGWIITGPLPGSSDNPRGWSVTPAGPCKYTICAPCLPADLQRSGSYSGPYTMTYADGTTCRDSSCNTHYKTRTAKFSLGADVICPHDKAGRQVSYDVSDGRRHVRAYVGNNTPGMPGPVFVGLASNVLPLVWNDARTQMMANDVCIRWDRQSTGSPLFMLSETTTVIQLFKSVDEGTTWTFVTNVGMGKHPALLIARDGRRYCFWVNATNVQCKIFDVAGNVWKDTFNVAANAGDDGLCADEFTVGQSKWGVLLVYGGAAVSSTDGVSFGRTFGGGGKHAAVCVGRDNRRLFYWYDATKKALLGQIWDAVGNVLKPTFTAVPGVDDDGIAVDEFTTDQSKWNIGLLYRSGGNLTFRASSDGVVF